MTSPWKKARIAGVSRFIAGIRSKRAGSSLVVEIGFPTSLADLVVKNRDRLKKPSWKKKPSPASDPDSDITTAASAVRSASSSGVPVIGIGEEPRPPVVEDVQRPVPVPVGTKSRGCGFGFRFLAAMLLVLVLLVAIGRKKLVAGITISAFALLILEIVGFRVFEFLRPCSVARKSLNSVVGGLEFRGREQVSPIREVMVESRSDSLGSDRSWGESVVSDQASEVSSERSDVVAVGKACADPNTVSSGNSKAKTMWRKFVPKKFRKGTVGKDGKDHDSGSIGRTVSDCNREEEGGMSKEQEEEELSDEKALSFRASDEVFHFDTEDVRENAGGTRLGSSRQLVFFIVVLLGLTGGRVVALVVTAAWYLLAKLIELSWRKCKAHRIS